MIPPPVLRPVGPTSVVRTSLFQAASPPGKTGGGMTLKQGLMLVALVVGIGMSRVAQQTALCLAAYDVGHRHVKCHELESQTLWLKTKIVGLQSPLRLAQTMKSRHVELVAWSELAPTPKSAQLVKANTVDSREQFSD